MPRRVREPADYFIDSLARALIVLEALEGIGFEPVTISTVCGRTGFSRDFVFRALVTLESRGYVSRRGRSRWTVGKRVTRFGVEAAKAGI